LAVTVGFLCYSVKSNATVLIHYTILTIKQQILILKTAVYIVLPVTATDQKPQKSLNKLQYCLHRRHYNIGQNWRVYMYSQVTTYNRHTDTLTRVTTTPFPSPTNPINNSDSNNAKSDAGLMLIWQYRECLP